MNCRGLPPTRIAQFAGRVPNLQPDQGDDLRAKLEEMCRRVQESRERAALILAEAERVVAEVSRQREHLRKS